MSYTVVMPYAYQPYKDACAATWKFDDASLLLVDNTEQNVGIQRAYNMGIDKMRADDSDWLIHLSAAVRFGDPGGLDFIDQLDQHPDHLIVENATSYGWHLIAFNRKAIDVVGYWDMNFWPYCYDDLDWSVRFQTAFAGVDLNTVWLKTPTDLEDMGMAHGVKLANCVYSNVRHIQYFSAKWGRHPDQPQYPSYEHPFNRPECPLDWWPSVKVPVDNVTYHCNGGRTS